MAKSNIEMKQLLSKDYDLGLIEEINKVLTEHFKSPIQIESVTRLSHPDRRNLVLRIKLQSPSNEVPVPKTLILKQSLQIKDSNDDKALLGRFARDWAGLEFSSSVHDEELFTPKFYSGSEKYRFILQEDLGEKHINLVDSLTSNDRNAAITAVIRYMKCMAQLHANGYKHTDEYNKILKSVNSEANNWLCDFEDLLSKTKDILKEIDVDFTPELEKEMRDIFKLMQQSENFITLIHGDICPDNLFYDAKHDKMRFIDFEWSFVGNALLDATYLRMSMPTGWCVKAFPKDLIEKAENIYRQELMKSIPAATDNNLYTESYVGACAYWIIMLLAYDVKKVLDKEYDIFQSNLPPHWKPEDNLKRPQYLYRLQAFLDVSSKNEEFLPCMRMTAKNVLDKLNIRWPETKSLDLFPAFTETSIKFKFDFFKAPSLQKQLEMENTLKDQTQRDPYGPYAIVPYIKK